MKGLSFTQPWASLIAVGAKRIETRAWATDYRGPVAVHAARKFPAEIADLCFEEPFRGLLRAHGFITDDPLRLVSRARGQAEIGWRQIVRLPRGVIVAVAELVNVQPTARVRDVVDSTERALGDFRTGRYAWCFEHARALRVPIPCVGGLGLWPVPAEIAERLERGGNSG